MKIAFRADASLKIGTGHVMRCLTLADALRAHGAECHFLCREHPGHLTDRIRARGHQVHCLPMGSGADQDLAHSGWLGATQTEDAKACLRRMMALQPDWLVVDHYALDRRWEAALASTYGRLLVIDDLADRVHTSDVLLDQTFGREATDYLGMVPPSSQLLCGSHYALLRPEFADLRERSLAHRESPEVRRVLVSMGGVDKDNVSCAVLQALRTCALPKECKISLVMGATSPYLAQVQQHAQQMPWPTEVLVGVDRMAQLMASSDVSIGAAGATSWERCCMGLPTAMLVLADNQRHAASLLAQAGAVRIVQLGTLPDDIKALVEQLVQTPQLLLEMSLEARRITDGLGTERVAKALMKEKTND